jgi:hypothetical protein
MVNEVGEADICGTPENKTTISRLIFKEFWSAVVAVTVCGRELAEEPPLMLEYFNGIY